MLTNAIKNQERKRGLNPSEINFIQEIAKDVF